MIEISTKDFNREHDSHWVNSLKEALAAGDVVVWRNFLDPEDAYEITRYLTRVGQHSLPNYAPITSSTPNFHRLNQNDERAIVKGCFHQFSFFPWNQDVFDLFTVFRPLFEMKNLLGGLPRDSFLARQGNDGVVSRLSFQFYPSGTGHLNTHRDPVGSHQLVVPTVCLSKKGTDFSEGGAYAIDETGVQHDLDSELNVGDVQFFNASMRHGVELIDPSQPSRWLDFRGRWVLLIATNKVAGNSEIADAIEA
jgi:hypothetical protein